MNNKEVTSEDLQEMHLKVEQTAEEEFVSRWGWDFFFFFEKPLEKLF